MNVVDDYNDDAVSYDALAEDEFDENEYENRYENYCRNKIKINDDNKEKIASEKLNESSAEDTEIPDHTEPTSNVNDVNDDLEVSTNQISDQSISSYNQETKINEKKEENEIIGGSEESEEGVPVDQDAIKPEIDLNDDLKSNLNFDLFSKSI